MDFYLEGNLRRESELVSLKQASGGIHKDRVGDTVNEVLHPLVDILRLLSSLYGLVEHHTESL